MKGWHKAAIAAVIVVGIVLLMQVAIPSLLPQPAQASPDPDWWDYLWQNRMKLTFNNSGQSENLIDLPVLVKLTPSNFDYSGCESDGRDIRFIDDNDSTQLKYQFEKWNYNGNSWIWVRVTQIDGGSDTDYIWLYYGYDHATDAQDEHGVWDDNFVAVWHLCEDSGPVYDSTQYANTAAAVNNTIQGATGEINGAYEFDGASDGAQTSSFVGDELSDFSELTLEGWIDIDTYKPEAAILGKQWPGPSDPWTQYALALGQAGNNSTYVSVTCGGSRVQCWSAVNSISTTGFYYVAGTWNGSDLQNYVNGVASGTACAQSGTMDQNDEEVFIGKFDFGGGSYDVDGIIDEVRISNVARSADWIKASYLAGTDSFITFGAGAHWGVPYNLSGWACCSSPAEIREITIDGWLLVEDRGHALNTTALRLVGTLNMTGTVNDSYEVDLHGTGVRRVFYVNQEAKGISASIGGVFQPTGNNTYYICSAGWAAFPSTGNMSLKTFKLCVLWIQVPGQQVPRVERGSWAANLDFIAMSAARVLHDLMGSLEGTGVRQLFDDSVSALAALVVGVRDKLVEPYFP